MGSNSKGSGGLRKRGGGGGGGGKHKGGSSSGSCSGSGYYKNKKNNKNAANKDAESNNSGENDSGGDDDDSNHHHRSIGSGSGSTFFIKQYMEYIVIALLTLIVYNPILTGGGSYGGGGGNDSNNNNNNKPGFVWDDECFKDAPSIHDDSSSSLKGLYDIWMNPITALPNEIHYWPVTYTTFWFEYNWIWVYFGMRSNPIGYHCTNVVLHIVNACLLMKLLHGVLGITNKTSAWFAALVFAIHPVNVESVAWIIERKDVLSTFFYLLAVLYYPAFYNNRINNKNKQSSSSSFNRTTTTTVWKSLLFYVLALWSKSIVVSLPFVLLLLVWMLSGHIKKRDIVQTIPFWVVGLILTAYDVTMARGREPVDFSYLSFVDRIFIASRAVCFYATQLLLWPRPRSIIYPKWDLHDDDPTMWYLCLAATPIVFVITLLIAFGGSTSTSSTSTVLSRGPLTALLFFGATLAPTLCLIDYGYMRYSYVADRYQYLAGIGPIVVFSVVATRYERSRSSRMRVALTMSLVLLVTGMLSWQHSAVYHNNTTFYSHIAKHNPRALYAYANLGNEQARADKIDAAEFSYREAEKYYELDAKHHTNYGILLASFKRFDESILHLRKSVEKDPNNFKAYNALGNYYSDIKQHEEAIKNFRRALELNPNYVIGWNNMASDYLRLGKYEDAVVAYKRAISILPSYVKARINLSEALKALNRRQEQIEQLQKVLEKEDNLLARSKLEEALAALASPITPPAQPIPPIPPVPAPDPTTAPDPDPAPVPPDLTPIPDPDPVPVPPVRIENVPVPPVPVSDRTPIPDPDPAPVPPIRNENVLAPEALTKIIEEDPTNVKALNELGNIYSDANKPAEAVKYFRRALEQDPKYAIGWNNLASELTRLNKLKEALESYKRAIELDPSYVKARINLAEVLRGLGRDAEQMAQLLEVIAVDPNNDIAKARLEKAKALEEEPHMALMKILDFDPYHVPALNELGNYYSGINQHSEAVKYFRRAVDQNPNYAIGWNNLGSDLTRLGNYQDALEAYKKAVETAPSYVKARINLSAVLGGLGHLKEQEEQLREVLAIDPGNSIAKTRLEAALAAQNS